MNTPARFFIYNVPSLVLVISAGVVAGMWTFIGV